MKYYSEITKNHYDTEKQCLDAEATAIAKANEEKAKLEALKKERADRAKEVEDALKAANEAEKHAHELLTKFVNDYGSFHSTIRDVPSPFYLFDLLFR